MANPSETPKVGRDGTVTFYDNAGFGGANTFTATYIRGDVSLNFGAKAEMIHIFVRGDHKSTRKGNDPIIEGSFSAPLIQFTNGSNEVLADVLDGTGAINGAWTKQSAKVEHWNVGIRFQWDGTSHGDAANHYLDLKGCVCTWEIGESVNGEASINVSFTSPRFREMTKGGPS